MRSESDGEKEYKIRCAGLAAIRIHEVVWVVGRVKQESLSRKHSPDLKPRYISTCYTASRTTPPAISNAAIHLRRSTRSCRNIFAAMALVTNVSAAAAGPIRLTSFQERPKRRA